MKRKVFSSLLLLVTMVAAGSMLFVSCKDYDDDINDLYSKIESNATDLTSLVDEKVNNATVEIADLQAQATALQAAYEAADQALQATMQAAIDNAYASAAGYADALSSAANAYTDSQTSSALGSANSYTDSQVNSALGSANSYTDSQTSSALSSANSYTDTQTTAANAYAEVQAAAAQAAAIAAAQDAVSEAASTLQAALSSATATLEAQGISINEISTSLSSQGNSISDLQASVTALVAADATLTQGITAAQARADEAYELAQSAQTLAETNKANLEALQTSVNSDISSLQASIDNMQTLIDAIQGNVSSNSSALQGSIEDAKSALQAEIEAAESSLQSQIDGVSGDLSSTAAELWYQINALNALIASLDGDNTTSAASLQDQINAVKELIAGNTSNIEKLQELAETINTAVSANTTSIQDINISVAGLQTSVTYLDAQVSVLGENVQTVLTMATNNAANITSLTTQLNSLSSSNEEMRYALVTQLKAYVEDLQSQITSNGSSISQNASDISAIQEVLDKLSTALAKCESDIEANNTAISANSSAIAANTTDIKTNAENIATNTSAISELRGQIEGVKETISALTGISSDYLESLQKMIEQYENMEDMLATSQKEIMEALDKEVEELTTYIDEKVDETNTKVSELQTSLEKQLSALETSISDGLSALQGDYEGSMSDLEASINQAVIAANAYAVAYADKVAEQLSEDIATAQDAADTANASIEELRTLYEDADKDLQEQIDEIVYVYLQDLADKIDAANSDIQANAGDVTKALEDYAKAEDLATAQKALDQLAIDLGLANETLTGVSGTVDEIYSDYITSVALEETLNAYLKIADLGNYGYVTIEDLRDNYLSGYATSEELTTVTETLNEVISNVDVVVGVVNSNAIALFSLQNLVTTLQSQVSSNFTTLKELIDANTTSIENLQSFVETVVKSAVATEAQRLKSLVLAPTTYMAGIECILFSSFQYTAWTDPEADEPDGEVITVSGDSHMEEYFVNPSNVAKESIKSLSFVSNTASDIATRAVSSEAPVAVESYDITENDVKVLQVSLVKTGSDYFDLDASSFTIVALKAVIADEYLTEEEKASGAEVAVYSDWARLCEQVTTPYIHNALAVDENDKIDEEAEDAHFWSYSEATDGTANVVAAEEDYNSEEGVDLSELVEICDKDGNTYEGASYGFTFEFTVVKNDMSDYASIEEGTSILTALGGRSAIGKTPLIRVELKDGDNVVDVRYFEIKWIDVEGVKYYDKLPVNETDFVCGGNEIEGYEENGYQLTISAEDVAAIYEEYNLSEEEFFGSYTLKTGLYASKEDAETLVTEEPAEVDENLGTIVEGTDDEGNKTLVWTITNTDEALLAATDDDYAAGSKTIDAYAVYASESGTNIVIIKLTLTLDIDPLELQANHFETMWTSESGARVVNPQLETDAVYGKSNYLTTMMKASLLEGYIKDGAVPTDINELVVTEGREDSEAQFVFDENKLDEIAEATGTTVEQWSLSEDGMTLYYQADLDDEESVPEPAAVIVPSDANGDYMVQLYEGDDAGNPGEPTEGAKLLIGNYVPVKLVDTWCGFTATIEDYNVNFLTPLAFTNGEINLTLQDITAGGSTGNSVSLDGTIEITEEAVVNHRVVWDNKATNSKTNATLVAWYGLEEPVYDLANAKTNLQLDGKIGTECNVLLSKITRNGEQAYRIEYDEANNAFVFYNESGSAISQEFKIDVPVIVESKWQTLPVLTVHITIVPGHSLTVRQK